MLNPDSNVRTPPIARWKAVVDFLFATTELFATYYGRNDKRKSVDVGGSRTGVGHANFRRKGRHPPTTVGVRKLE